jgi:hypothetical protein
LFTIETKTIVYFPLRCQTVVAHHFIAVQLEAQALLGGEMLYLCHSRCLTCQLTAVTSNGASPASAVMVCGCQTKTSSTCLLAIPFRDSSWVPVSPLEWHRVLLFSQSTIGGVAIVFVPANQDDTTAPAATAISGEELRSVSPLANHDLLQYLYSPLWRQMARASLPDPVVCETPAEPATPRPFEVCLPQPMDYWPNPLTSSSQPGRPPSSMYEGLVESTIDSTEDHTLSPKTKHLDQVDEINCRKGMKLMRWGRSKLTIQLVTRLAELLKLSSKMRCDVLGAYKLMKKEPVTFYLSAKATHKATKSHVALPRCRAARDGRQSLKKIFGYKASLSPANLTLLTWMAALRNLQRAQQLVGLDDCMCLSALAKDPLTMNPYQIVTALHERTGLAAIPTGSAKLPVASYRRMRRSLD